MEKARMGMWAVLLAVAVWVSWLAVGMVQGRTVQPQQRVRISAVLYISQNQGSQQGAYSVLGSPTVSASFIDRVLSAYHSPAAGLGPVIENRGCATVSTRCTRWPSSGTNPVSARQERRG